MIGKDTVSSADRPSLTADDARELEHGLNAYRRHVNPCRCDICRRAKADYQRALRKRRKDQRGDFTHGTYSGYVEQFCRCRDCRNAATVQRQVEMDRARRRPIPEGAHGTYRGYNFYACRCERCGVAASAYWQTLKARRAAAS